MKRFRFLYWLFTGILCVSLLGAFWSGTLFDNSVKASTLPTTTWQGTSLPNWDQISFSTMPGIIESGFFHAPPGTIEQLGYDPSRTWHAGETADVYSKLGDFEDSFNLQQLSLADIAHSSGNNLVDLSLEAFEVMQAQTLESLLAALPQLNTLQVAQIPPVFDLLRTHTGNFNPSLSLSSLLQTNPSLEQLRFDTLNLQSYSLGDIPGLSQAPLSHFKDWRNASIQGVPSLRDLPFSQFPNPPVAMGTTVGRVDVAFGVAEQQANRTISGSAQEGFSVPCQTNCAHVELAGNEAVLGRQWISGKYQEVRGGFGLLGFTNNGLEPTGRHPFGKAFKVVVWDVSEVEGRVDTALFFRFCQRGFPDLGCTPYFIGPIGWFSYSEASDVMFLGDLDIVVQDPPIEDNAVISQDSPSPLNNFIGSFAGLAQINGVNVNNLAHSISSVEGSYDSVGVHTCSRGQCGRGLGAFQLMSYRSDVQTLIGRKPGGEEFLSNLANSNAKINSSELLYYFPPDEQESLFRADLYNLVQSAQQEIDPTTAVTFSGDRLIERIAQKHFGGSSVPIDSSVSDVHGHLSVKRYGQTVAEHYKSLQF